VTDITLNRVFRAALRRATIGNIYDAHTHATIALIIIFISICSLNFH